jgi:ubiquinone/menaquinone biosynthesis C-methylase UbiE
LDIASGTGRFISFVLDNYRTLDTTVLDLSPFYLAECKKALKK